MSSTYHIDIENGSERSGEEQLTEDAQNFCISRELMAIALAFLMASHNVLVATMPADLGRFKSLHHYQAVENEWGALMSSFSIWTVLALLYLAIASIEATLVDRRLLKPILNRLGLALTIESVIATGWTYTYIVECNAMLESDFYCDGWTSAMIILQILISTLWVVSFTQIFLPFVLAIFSNNRDSTLWALLAAYVADYPWTEEVMDVIRLEDETEIRTPTVEKRILLV